MLDDLSFIWIYTNTFDNLCMFITHSHISTAAAPCTSDKKNLPMLNVTINLPGAPAGTVIKRSVCPVNGEPLVTATCMPNDDRLTSRWALVIAECRFENDEKLPNTTKKLAALSIANLVSCKKQIHHGMGSKPD